MDEENSVPISNERIKKVQQKAQNLQAYCSENQQDAIQKIQVKCQQIKNYQVSTICRGHTTIYDEPVNDGGDDQALTPIESLLSALASCIEISWLTYLSIFKIKIERISVEVEGTLDIRYILCKADEFPPRYQSIKIVSYIVAGEVELKRKKIMRVFERVKATCGVGGSLHPAITKDYQIEIIESAVEAS
jgi:uncharacterized OsmC-like protein